MNQRIPPRIQRQELPPVMRGRTGYRNAEPHLRRDFGFRCAYCRVHEQIKGGPQAFCIDHFKPRSRGGPVNDYTNLYWVCIPCNMIKHSKWPTNEQLRRGYRFADPCREQDAGIHFIESGKGLDGNPKLFALLYRFWYRWRKSAQTKRNVEVFNRKLREYCRGQKFLAGQTPRIAPWWKPASNSKN